MGKEEKMEGKKNGGKKKHCIDVWQYGKLNIKLTSWWVANRVKKRNEKRKKKKQIIWEQVWMRVFVKRVDGYNSSCVNLNRNRLSFSLRTNPTRRKVEARLSNFS